MRNSKDKSKRNSALPGEPLSKKEFVASIKEAEKGPFKPIENLEEEVKLKWEKNSDSKTGNNVAPFGLPLSKEEFIQSIKEAEKGPFYTHNEFVLKFNS